jgi:SAM-dependent methyltransferase
MRSELAAVDMLLTGADWEAAFAPYDEETYRAALAFIQPGDVALDIGAGDLRFARRAAARARRVVAVERHRALLPSLVERGAEEAGNLIVICADALTWPFPFGVTVGVLLMRHCRHFREYAAKLRAVGCARLITNARWGMGVEQIALDGPRPAYHALESRWYACACGAVGFAPGPAHLIDARRLAQVVEVSDCPMCIAT